MGVRSSRRPGYASVSSFWRLNFRPSCDCLFKVSNAARGGGEAATAATLCSDFFIVLMYFLFRVVVEFSEGS